MSGVPCISTATYQWPGGLAGLPVPYSRAATEEFELVHNGGKQDDITVVVGVLHPLEGGMEQEGATTEMLR